MAQEPLDDILKNYGIDVLGVRNESYKGKKGVWWIQTPKGQKILKKFSGSEDTLKHILHAVRHLTQKGICIPAVCRTLAGEEYVIKDGICYVLSDAVNGKNPSYDSKQELMKTVRGLAGFHAASAGFFPVPGSKPKVHLGTWIEDYEKQVEDMNSFYKSELSRGAGDPVGEVVTSEFPYFYDRAYKAINGLKGKEYREWNEKAGQAGCLCHQDFAAGNLILDAAGNLFVLDTDSLTVDIPARDIRKLLNKIMKKAGRWDTELTGNILKYYQDVNPLTLSEWRVVELDLLFPHLFLGAMNKYYYKRDKEWSIGKYLQRIREMASFEKTIEPVLDNFESLIPV